MIDIKVFDHKTIGPNSLIGVASFSLDSVYCSENHAFLYKYIPIQNVEKNHQEVFGFLKLSVHAARPGDERVNTANHSFGCKTNQKRRNLKAMGETCRVWSCQPT